MKTTVLLAILLTVLISCNNKKTEKVKLDSPITSIIKDSISKESRKEEFDDKSNSINTNDKILSEYADSNYEVTSYYDSGKISSITVTPKTARTRDFVQGADVRELIYYFENGKIESKIRMMGTKKNGETISYYPSGQLRSKDNYMGDVLIDESIRYYENGQLMYRTKYVYGKPEGNSISYHENGKIMTNENFVGGQSDGEFVRYYDNGQLEVKINFIKGKYDGRCIWYFKNGNIDRTEEYSNGKLIGESKRYYENGIIKKNINNDTKIIIDYDTDGNPISKNE